jgi:hypothetical protein
MKLLLSWLLLPSLLLAFTYTEYELYSCIQPLKTKLFQRVHYKLLCMVFQTIPSKFSCATFQNLQNTSHFVTLFLAHEDIVVGFVIFHTKLSTPRLACFICSSLILQGSWSDHYNFKKKKERKRLHGMRLLAGARRIRLAIVCERKGWEECQTL